MQQITHADLPGGNDLFVPLFGTLAVWDVRRTSFSIPVRTVATVNSSNCDPRCMMEAISGDESLSDAK